MSDWVEDTLYCDGASILVLTMRTCIFPMDFLRGQHGYEFNQLPQFKVRSRNLFGWSLEYSPPNTVGVTVRIEPTKMGTVLNNAFETTTERVTVFWNELTTYDSRGGSQILSYNLQWDSGTSGAQWTDLVGNPFSSMQTTFTVHTGVADGDVY